MAGQGAIFLLPGDTLKLMHYEQLIRWIEIFPGDETLYGLMVLVVGLARWAALIINGWHHSTPGWRIAGCLVGSFYWTTLTFSFLAASKFVPVAALSWTVTAFAFEVFSAMRAASDAFLADTFGLEIKKRKKDEAEYVRRRFGRS
jgi:hypothetical protein